MLKAQSLRPGYLVYCTARVQGGVSYAHEDEQTSRDGTREVKTYTTTKVVEDKEERERAEACRTLARTTIIRACWPSTFGLITPLEDMGAKGPTALRSAIVEAQKAVSDFNATATTCRVLLTVIPARIESSDVAAMAGIASEIEALLGEMANELKLGQPDAARKLAARMKDLGRMLDNDAQEMVTEAIAAARRAARKIVKEGADTAAQAAALLEDMDIGAIDAARVAFLDLGQRCVEETAMPVADAQRVAGIDIGEIVHREPEATDESPRIDYDDSGIGPVRAALETARPALDLD